MIHHEDTKATGEDSCGFAFKKNGLPPRHQDTKKSKGSALMVLLGITCSDTGDTKKLGVLVSWW
jgi:hypothetical protein